MQEEVVRLTYHYIDLAASALNINMEKIPVQFDLKGKCAGMYRSNSKGKLIRYNPYIFAKYYEDNLLNTVPHEVAHYAAHCANGRKTIKPHGKEWRTIMEHFGCKPMVTSSYDLSGIPVKRQRTFSYRCHCDQYQLTIIRHRKIVQSKTQYFCKKCKTQLIRDHDA